MLTDKNFYHYYSQISDHKPPEFFTQALINSVQLDLGLGYFSSASFNVLANGLAHFIVNNGYMNLYINQYISKDDYELLRGAHDNKFDEDLTLSFINLRKTFAKRDEHFFQCLAYLIQKARINIKIVVLCNGGLPHEKYGIFTDERNNKIYFIGSMNMTANGLMGSLENIDCTCSWKGEDSLEKVLCQEQHFYDVWNKKCPGVMIYEAKKFCNEILKTYPSHNIDSLVLKENEFIKEEEFRERMKINENFDTSYTPRFPSKYEGGARPYQIEAYQAWLKHGKVGLFAMATGTGKTVTSLNCALNEFVIDGYYNLLILVPSIDLIDQWKNELVNFNFKRILCVYSNNHSWKSEMAEIVQKIKRGKGIDFVLLSTYDSFVSKDFQKMLPELSKSMILIADEAHNIGGNSVRSCFDKMQIKRRIGLSATPERIYDEETTKGVAEFFNDKYPYTYSFPMSRAIEEGRLCRYFYYPKIAYLNEEEMKLYVDMSKKLAKLSATKEKTSDINEKINNLFLMRKRIIHKCHDKLRAYKEILKEIGEENLKYTFVYTPQGKYDVLGLRNEVSLSEQDDISFIMKLLNLTKDIYHSKRCNTYTSKDNKEKRSALLNAFAEGKLDVLFAMKCLDEGIDVPRAERGIFISSTCNPREFIQRRGRLLRNHPDKEYSYIYDIIVVPLKTSQPDVFFSIEQSMIKSELKRAAHFASLAENHITGAYVTLKEIASNYEIFWDDLISEAKQ